MEISLTIVTFIFLGLVYVCGRDIRRQVDYLERRYENDYVSVKENLRDLWDNIYQLENVCALNAETSIDNPLAEQSPAQRKEAAVKHNPSLHVSQLVQGLSEEKVFLRKKLDHLTGLIAEVRNSCTSTVTKKMNRISEIETQYYTVENEVEKLHEKHAELSARLEMMKLMIELEVEGLQLGINKALEEVIHKPASCSDIAEGGVTASGVYTLHYRMQPFIVYCLMGEHGGYTFFSPETYFNVDIKSLSNDNSHVIIRHRRTNGLQYESRIEQISKYKSRPLSIQYNSHTGYTDVINNKMTPYIYLGITPVKLNNGRSHKGDSQGYKSNGKDFTFVNCDGNPNGYFAFLFNHNKVATSRKGQSPAISRKWIDSSTRVTGDILPDKFMSFFELHFGGCGAYAGTNHFGDVTGAALGIPYSL